MSEFNEKAILVILGWLLGLLGPIIVDIIRNKREAENGRKAILAELLELNSVLVIATYRIKASSGKIDRPFLEWLSKRLRSETSELGQELLSAAQEVLALPNEQIVHGATRLATAAGKAPMLQKYPAPLLDARVTALWTFDTTLQRNLLKIHRDITLLDNIVDQSREYFRLTFNNLSPETYAAVVDNMRIGYDNYAERAQIIVDSIVVLAPNGKV